MKQVVNVTAPFPVELDLEARIIAAKKGISRSELIRRAVIDYLARLTPKSEQLTQPNPQEAPHEKQN